MLVKRIKDLELKLSLALMQTKSGNIFMKREVTWFKTIVLQGWTVTEALQDYYEGQKDLIILHTHPQFRLFKRKESNVKGREKAILNWVVLIGLCNIDSLSSGVQNQILLTVLNWAYNMSKIQTFYFSYMNRI